MLLLYQFSYSYRASKSVIIDSSGISQYAANYNNDNVHAFVINKISGELTPISNYAVGVGSKQVVAVH